MSLAGFDTLRRDHPERGTTIRRLEETVASILKADASAVLRETYLSNLTKLPAEEVEECLVDLMRASALEIRVAFICPTTHGTAREAHELKDLPSRFECDKCGQVHRYDPAMIEVFFIATKRLLESLREAKGGG